MGTPDYIEAEELLASWATVNLSRRNFSFGSCFGRDQQGASTGHGILSMLWCHRLSASVFTGPVITEAGIAYSVYRLGYGLASRGLCFESRQRQGIILLSKALAMSLFSLPRPLLNGLRGILPAVKLPEPEAEHSCPSCIEIKSEWRYTYCHNMISWRT